MQHVFRSALALLTAGLVFFSVSCNKKADVQKLPGEAEANYWPDQRYCNIDSIQVTDRHKYYKFSYDYFGNPVSIITNGTSTADPNWFFYYDDKRRMKKYIRLYENGFFETYKVFFYGPDNKVIYDSSYQFGALTDGVPSWWMSTYVTTYSYDSLGRISFTSTTITESPKDTIKQAFNYDVNGNLIKPGVTYDNRNNIHNTNNWWRLIDKDYSKNNPFRASSYIGYLLPRDIFFGPDHNDRYFLGLDILPHANIRYICGN